MLLTKISVHRDAWQNKIKNENERIYIQTAVQCSNKIHNCLWAERQRKTKGIVCCRYWFDVCTHSALMGRTAKFWIGLYRQETGWRSKHYCMICRFLWGAFLLSIFVLFIIVFGVLCGLRSCMRALVRIRARHAAVVDGLSSVFSQSVSVRQPNDSQQPMRI